MSETLYGENGVDGTGGAHGTTESVGGWGGQNGTDGESVSYSITDLETDVYHSVLIRAGAGGHGGSGGNGAWNSYSGEGFEVINQGWGGDGGHAGNGGDAFGEIVGAVSTRELRVDAYAGTGGHGGFGGQAGTYPYDGRGLGAHGGDAGYSGAGGSAVAQILNSTITASWSSSGGLQGQRAISAHAVGGSGGSGASGGYGGGGVPPGTGGLSRSGGNGGDATAIIAGNTLLGEGSVSLSASATVGTGGSGAYASASGPGADGRRDYGQPGLAGESGHGHVEISGNVIEAGVFNTTVSISLNAHGNTNVGGWTYVNGIFVPGTAGKAPTADILFADNRITFGDGDDVLDFSLNMTKGFNFSATGNVITGGGGYDTLRLSAYLKDYNGHIIAPINLDMGMLGISGFERVQGSDLKDEIRAGNEGVRIEGFGGDDRLFSGVGRDELYGGIGDDWLSGGLGADVLDGGDGNDTVSYADINAKVTVDLSVNGRQQTGGAGQDRLISIENLIGTVRNDVLSGDQKANQLDGGAGNDQLFGRAGADILIGGEGNDLLDGGDGNDILIGGLGRDTMTGGAGADRFVFNAEDVGATRGAADVITDFSRAERDKIDLSSFDARPGTPEIDAFTFIRANRFSGAAGEIRYQIKDGSTTIMGDLDGDGGADFYIRLDGEHKLVANDFLFAAPILDALI